MKTLITLSLLIVSLLSNIEAQNVTFQSHMNTTKWASSVTLNGNPLTESSSDVFDIPPADVLPGTNIIEVQSIVGALNGVSTLDVVLINRALYGIAPLDLEAVIPADFDKSGFIGVNDIATMYTHILGIEEGVENSFVHSSVDLENLNPFDFGADVYKFKFEGSELATTNFVFNVFKSGDVNKSAFLLPENNQETEVRESNVRLSLEDINLTTGDTYQVPFSILSSKKIEAFQIGTELNGISITDIQLTDESYAIDSHVTEEKARFIVVSDDAINDVQGMITITADRDGKLSEMLEQEVNFFDEIVFTDLSTQGLELEFSTVSALGELTASDVVLSPNPASQQINISFPESSKSTTLYITNAQGQLMITKSLSGSSISILREDLVQPGMYIMTISQEGQTVQKKFVVL